MGVTLTKNIARLKGANYKTTGRKIQMLIISKMFYLFQVLPEGISKKQFTAWGDGLKNWILGRKSARTVRKGIHSPQEGLGWGTPHLERDDEAFQVRMPLEMDGKSSHQWGRFNQ